MSFYAVRVGKVPGIYKTWDECRAQVTGFKGAIYKKFYSEETAQTFIDTKSKTYKSKTSNGYTRIKKVKPKINYIKDPNTLYIFTDGSSVGNGSADANAGYGVYIPEPEEYAIQLRGSLPNGSTNNCAELTAIRDALKIHNYNSVVKNSQTSKTPINNIVIVTDSDYSIKCITKWSDNWAKNGWRTNDGDVINKSLIQDILKLYKKYKKHVTFLHINSHTPHRSFFYDGNRFADMLANSTET